MKAIIIWMLFFLSYDVASSQGLLKSLFSSGKQDLVFVKNQPIDKPMAELNKKYRNGFQTIPCFDWIRKMSKDKKIKCMTLPLSARLYRDDLTAVVQEGKVILYGRGLAGNRDAVMLNAPTPEEEFGDAIPNAIYESPRARGVQNFALLWDLKPGYVRAMVTCSLKKYAGKTTVGPLRECAMHLMIISRMQEYSTEENQFMNEKSLKISDEKY